MAFSHCLNTLNRGVKQDIRRTRIIQTESDISPVREPGEPEVKQ